MYDFSYADAEEIGKRIRVGDKTLIKFLEKKGLPKERINLVINPATGLKVSDLPKAEKNAYFYNRGVEEVRRWLNTGGRSIGDGRAEVHVPGEYQQMEHQGAFSKSIDVLGDASNYYSDDKYNKAGYLEYHENQEKGDRLTSDYHKARRMQLVARDRGIGDVNLREDVNQMIPEKFTPVSYSNESRKINRKASINLDNLEKGLEMMNFINQIY